MSHIIALPKSGPVGTVSRTETAREMFDWSEAHAERTAWSALAAELTDRELALIAAQGFARLLRDINSSETMLDLVALRLKRAADRRKSKALLDVAAKRLECMSAAPVLEGESLPGHERGLDWFDTACRNGCVDGDA